MNPIGLLTRRLPDLVRSLLPDVCARGRRTPDGECSEDCASRPLTRVPPGTRGTVSCLRDPADRESRKLASLGFLPGVPVRLLQKRPVYVVRSRNTEYALDEELAARVRIVPGDAGQSSPP